MQKILVECEFEFLLVINQSAFHKPNDSINQEQQQLKNNQH